VEPREMIHVGVRDENMADAQDFAGRKAMDIAEVEENGPAAEAESDQEPRVGEHVVDQPRLHEPGHRSLSPARNPRRAPPDGPGSKRLIDPETAGRWRTRRRRTAARLGAKKNFSDAGTRLLPASSAAVRG